MQGKSKHYFPNHLLFAALANILGRENPCTIPPYFMRKRGFLLPYQKKMQAVLPEHTRAIACT